MIIWAFSLLVVVNALYGLALLVPEDAISDMEKTSAQVFEGIEEYVDVYQHAGYGEWVSYRLGKEIPAMVSNLLPSLIPVLAMFLFGLAAGKAGVFQETTKHLSFLKKIRLITFLISIPLVLVLALFKLDILDAGVKQIFVVQLFKSFTGISLCFFYISALTLLLRKEKWQKILRPLGYAGQMALTNYLSQTIISIIIFVGFGFYGQVSLAAGTLLCLLIFAAQIAFSTIWLRLYKFGPFEWLWRSFTYGKLQPMKKKERNNHHFTSK
jgi:uncharacterized protein